MARSAIVYYILLWRYKNRCDNSSHFKHFTQTHLYMQSKHETNNSTLETVVLGFVWSFENGKWKMCKVFEQYALERSESDLWTLKPCIAQTVAANLRTVFTLTMFVIFRGVPHSSASRRVSQVKIKNMFSIYELCGIWVRLIFYLNITSLQRISSIPSDHFRIRPHQHFQIWNSIWVPFGRIWSDPFFRGLHRKSIWRIYFSSTFQLNFNLIEISVAENVRHLNSFWIYFSKKCALLSLIGCTK